MGWSEQVNQKQEMFKKTIFNLTTMKTLNSEIHLVVINLYNDLAPIS